MRAFLAVKLSDMAVNEIANLQEELKKYTLKGRWTKKDNLHITLKFFGEINTDDVDKIKDATEDVAKSFSPFNIRIDKIGCFKGKESYRILWVGIDNDKELKILHDKIEDNLLKIGFKKDDRNFKTHITIARDISLNIDVNKINKIFQLKSDSFMVSNIYLMESKLENNKRIYTNIFDVLLNKVK